MTEYLCETCKHRRGKLTLYHRLDILGIERNVSDDYRVRCAAVHSNGGRAYEVKEAKVRPAYADPHTRCWDYTERKVPRWPNTSSNGLE